ncbi:ester cyclase [Pendulispora rubella]|uniref:Ester cyclase n=1 Tax=Pendulispora rubella TaxID=2741070 RepID=A0ABZ2L6W4_9BACT
MLSMLKPTLVLVALACAGCAPSSVAHNGDLGRRYFEEVWNQGRLEVLDELLSRDYINHTPSVPDPPPGPEGLKPIVAAIRKGFPDLHYRIEDMIVTEDRVVLRTIVTGTNTGELFGAPPTGQRVQVNQMNIEHIRNGRIAEHWRVTDELAMQQQLARR